MYNTGDLLLTTVELFLDSRGNTLKAEVLEGSDQKRRWVDVLPVNTFCTVVKQTEDDAGKILLTVRRDVIGPMMYIDAEHLEMVVPATMLIENRNVDSAD